MHRTPRGRHLPLAGSDQLEAAPIGAIPSFGQGRQGGKETFPKHQNKLRPPIGGFFEQDQAAHKKKPGVMTTGPAPPPRALTLLLDYLVSVGLARGNNRPPGGDGARSYAASSSA